MSLVNNIKESVKEGYSYFKSLQSRDNLKEVIDNSEVFKPLKVHQRLSESAGDIPVVNWQEYHLTTEDEIDESFIKMIAAPDYSSEDENYKK